VGEVTSGNFSPMLEQGIAMAFLPPDVELGAAVQIEARRDVLDGVVVEMPFYRSP
jgi:aminomethyltransferase